MGEHTFDTEELRAEGAVRMDEVVSLTRRQDQCRLEHLEAISRLETGSGFAYNGYTSTSAFLVHRCGMTPGQAQHEVFLARSLQHMPHAAKSVDEGELTVNQFVILAHARSRLPDEYEAEGAGLVDAVSGLGAVETRHAVDYWVQAHLLAPPKDDSEPEPSKVRMSKGMYGRGKINGDLDAETYSMVKAALDDLMTQDVRHTPREELAPAPVRRAQALAELARRHLDDDEGAKGHGNRPHITALIDYRTLTGERTDGVSELLDGTVISPDDIRRWACDASVCRLIAGPAGEILDLGRSQRTVTPAQWRALCIRDRHCRFPGCRRPPRWSDAHHILFWAEHDGPTDLNNLILLCRFHHTLIHREGWTITGTPDDLTFIRPDGTHLPNAPP